jgi:hypothetical protein
MLLGAMMQHGSLPGYAQYAVRTACLDDFCEHGSL